MNLTQRWHIPEIGFEVKLMVGSTVYSPEEITEFIRLQPTSVRKAKDAVRKYNIWTLEADPIYRTIEDHVNNILKAAEPYADRFSTLKDCEVSLNIYVYLDQYKAYHDEERTRFHLEPEWISLLSRMNASFTLD